MPHEGCFGQVLGCLLDMEGGSVEYGPFAMRAAPRSEKVSLNFIEPFADYRHVGSPRDRQLIGLTGPPSKARIELNSVDLCFVLERADLTAAPSIRALLTEKDVRVDSLRLSCQSKSLNCFGVLPESVAQHYHKVIVTVAPRVPPAAATEKVNDDGVHLLDQSFHDPVQFFRIVNLRSIRNERVSHG
jgi:hypothetical protein